MYLDLKDRKILYELDLNSRQPNVAIGKKVFLSKDSVSYRINKLIENKIITGLITRINATKLGYSFYNVFLKYQNIDLVVENELVKFILTHNQIGWVVNVLGNWDLVFVYWAESEEDFFNFWHTFISKFGTYIYDKEISTFYQEIACPKLFLLNKNICNEKEFVVLNKSNDKLRLDKKDLSILSLLAVNSRITTVEIAKKIKLTPKSVIYRINNLEKKEIILGYSISIDYKKLNYDYYKLEINFKNYSSELYEKFINFCKYNQNIIYIDKSIGGNDIKLNIYIENKLKYKELLNIIKQKFSYIIKNMETVQYFDELKHNLFPIKVD
ncbi:MAG: winged helix-turn-helix transcriptional regulator [Peptostreptococcales bacterium]